MKSILGKPKVNQMITMSLQVVEFSHHQVDKTWSYSCSARPAPVRSVHRLSGQDGRPPPWRWITTLKHSNH